MRLVFLLVLVGCSASSDVSRTLGARCDVRAECEERCLPGGVVFPGGFCTLSCLDQGDCPEGAVCSDENSGVCLFACTEAVDCEFLGAGWDCLSKGLLPEGEAMVCIGG